MKKKMFLTAVAIALGVGVLALISTPAFSKESKRPFVFVGLWENIDVVDGSEGTLSITPDEAGGFRVLIKTTDVSVCPSGGAGFSIGTATIEAGVLVSADRMIRCESGDDVSSPVEFVPDHRYDLLIMNFTGGQRLPIVWHRTSTSRVLGD